MLRSRAVIGSGQGVWEWGGYRDRSFGGVEWDVFKILNLKKEKCPIIS